MRLSALLLGAGVLAIVFGLGFLLAPGALLPVYGIAAEPSTILMSRFFGATLVQLGASLYLSRAVTESVVQRGFVLGGAMGSAAGLAVAIIGQRSGLVNSMGWTTVIIYGALLLAYGSMIPSRPVTA